MGAGHDVPSLPNGVHLAFPSSAAAVPAFRAGYNGMADQEGIEKPSPDPRDVLHWRRAPPNKDRQCAWVMLTPASVANTAETTVAPFGSDGFHAMRPPLEANVDVEENWPLAGTLPGVVERLCKAERQRQRTCRIRRACSPPGLLAPLAPREFPSARGADRAHLAAERAAVRTDVVPRQTKGLGANRRSRRRPIRRASRRRRRRAP